MRSIIVNSKEIKFFAIDRSTKFASASTTHSVEANQHNNTIIQLDYKGESVEEFKVILLGILARNRLDNFTVAEDTQTENTVTILREGDLEQFGIYICKHCGTPFKSIDERVFHERIHYFV